MKKILFIFSLTFCISYVQAQTHEIVKTVEDGIKASIQQTENHEWKEAFATCRTLDASIANYERTNEKQAPELRYQVAKERLRMYIRLKNGEQCKGQLERMEAYAVQAKQHTLDEDLLMTKADYYQKFGMTDKSLQCYKTLMRKRTAGESENDIDACYQDMLKYAKDTKNSLLERAMNKLYINWQDSIKSVKAAQELQSLQNEYTIARQTLEEKENKIKTQQGIIVLFGILTAILAGGLLLFIGMLLKNAGKMKRLKKSLVIANDNNELKSKFIANIGEQINPSLDALGKGNDRKHIDALKEMMAHVSTYMALESTREERYEVKELNICSLCESIMEKAKLSFRQEVEGSLNVPRVNVRTNAEALENILLYLLGNAARYTQMGKITLEFKKRSAHSGQFIVTDTGNGIPAEKRSNLFKPFAEVCDLTEGDGLGLPICSLIAYKLNGSLRLDEDYKRGTRFILELHS